MSWALLRLPSWELGGVVGHHADGEGEAGGRNEDTGERGVEEVRVAGDGVIEAGDAKVNQVGVLGVCVNSFDQGIVVLLELGTWTS
jgi:hypothetical protein